MQASSHTWLLQLVALRISGCHSTWTDDHHLSHTSHLPRLGVEEDDKYTCMSERLPNMGLPVLSVAANKQGAIQVRAGGEGLRDCAMCRVACVMVTELVPVLAV